MKQTQQNDWLNEEQRPADYLRLYLSLSNALETKICDTATIAMVAKIAWGEILARVRPRIRCFDTLFFGRDIIPSDILIIINCVDCNDKTRIQILSHETDRMPIFVASSIDESFRGCWFSFRHLQFFLLRLFSFHSTQEFTTVVRTTRYNAFRWNMSFSVSLGLEVREAKGIFGWCSATWRWATVFVLFKTVEEKENDTAPFRERISQGIFSCLNKWRELIEEFSWIVVSLCDFNTPQHRMSKYLFLKSFNISTLFLIWKLRSENLEFHSFLHVVHEWTEERLKTSRQVRLG